MGDAKHTLQLLLWSLLHCCSPWLQGLARILLTIEGDKAQVGLKGRGEKETARSDYLTPPLLRYQGHTVPLLLLKLFS